MGLIRLPRGSIACAAWVALLSTALTARAQVTTHAWYEGFEGPTPSWREAGANAQYQIEFHDRLRDDPHTGDRSERVVVRSAGGTFIYLGHDVGHPLVIDELLPTVWIKSDRAGLQFFAQVVLPRSPDRRTGHTLTALIPGTRYTNPGVWQQLRVEDIPRQLARQARALRAQYGPAVDEREAYVEMVMLNVNGGPGTTTVHIDDLDVRGHAARPETPQPAVAAPLRSGPGSTPNMAMVSTSSPSAALAAATAAHAPLEQSRVQFNGAILLVEDRPFFPRMLQHQGEPLELVRRLGFNALWLDQPAKPDMLAEAERLGLWVVCPPPRPEGLELTYGPVQQVPEFGPEYERVLAWNLGRGLSTPQLDATKRWAEQVRVAARKRNRPLVGQPDDDLRVYSRHLDLLLMGCRPIGTSLELPDYAQWLVQRPNLARPGTPVWSTVQTQLAPAVSEQLQALDPARVPPAALPIEQMRLLAYAALSAGARGLLFESHASLAGGDPDTQRRALAVELLNLELRLAESSAASGSLMGAATGKQPEISAAVLRTERARLLLPLWLEHGGQFVAGQSAANNLMLVAPGVPESAKAYELLPGRLRPLVHKRATGGLQVTLDEFGVADQVLMAQDPLVISTMSQLAEAVGPRAAELARKLAADKLAVVEQTAGELDRRGVRAPQYAQWISAARRNLLAADGHQTQQQHQLAYLAAQRSMTALRLTERSLWEACLPKLPSPLSSPATVSFATLPWHFKLQDRLAASLPDANRLTGGDFEDLATTLGANWQRLEHRAEGIITSGELAAQAAHTGRSGMRLGARPENPAVMPTLVESPPVWFVSPAVPVEQGDLLCIRGWVRIHPPLTATLDGLLIFDSFSREALAERIGQAAAWREFVLYRIATRTAPLTLTFALTGLGEVWLDDVSVQVLVPRGAGPALGPR